jgi:hypothetical protein
MTGALTSLRQEAADLLERRGVRAVTAFQPEGRKRWSEPVAAVSLAKVVCAPGGFKDYLGVRHDPDTGTDTELYGQAVELTLALDIYAPRDGGEDSCRQALDQMVEALTEEGAAGLSVREIESGEMTFLDESGMYRLPVRCRCQAWLVAQADESGEFVDFRVKGRTIV